MSSLVSGLTLDTGCSQLPGIPGWPGRMQPGISKALLPWKGKSRSRGMNLAFPWKGLDLEVSRQMLHMPESLPTLAAPGCNNFWVVFSPSSTFQLGQEYLAEGGMWDLPGVSGLSDLLPPTTRGDPWNHPREEQHWVPQSQSTFVNGAPSLMGHPNLRASSLMGHPHQWGASSLGCPHPQGTPIKGAPLSLGASHLHDTLVNRAPSLMGQHR